jgi:hypothetical protein
MALGYGIGDNPNEISISSISSLHGNTAFILTNEYTFNDPQPPVAFNINQGKVQILSFIQYDDTDSINFLEQLETINGNPNYDGDNNYNFNIVGILFNNGGSIPSLTFNSTVSSLRTNGVTFDLLNNGSWSGSSAEDYLTNYGGSVASPVVYIISKYYTIAYKTQLSDHTNVAAMIAAIDAQVSALLTGPTITSVSPSDSTTLNTLDTITITFSEKVQRSDGSEVDETCFRLTGAGVGTLYNPNPNSAGIQTGDLTELNYEIETGDVTHLPGNGAIALDISRIVTTELHITDQVFYTPVPLVGNNGHDYYTVNYTAGSPDLTPPRVISVKLNPHLG